MQRDTLCYAIIQAVKINRNFSGNRQRWIKAPLASDRYRNWLMEQGSLTARLQQKYADFYVEPVCIHYQKPASEEIAAMHIPEQCQAQIREVLLYGSGRPVVFAHSVLPRRSMRGEWHKLGRLGSKPLGAVLFASAQVRRTPLSYKKLSPHHVLYQKAVRYLAEKPQYLWARRSIFSLNDAGIMVVEVFLPELLRT